MTTIASPRPSIASLTTDSSSRRPSFDAPLQSPRLFEIPSSSLLTGSQRRNRVALRDYYKLTKNPKISASEASTPLHDEQLAGIVLESELDAEGFDAEGHVKGILAKEGLEGLLRLEGVLINEIKALDGEMKALVYDNYSKLITAMDTIKKMRTNMDPLTPTTSTLSPAISHIAETAASLSSSLPVRAGLDAQGEWQDVKVQGARMKKHRQQETVRWVLAAPRRLRTLVGEGRQKEAAGDWFEVRRLLGKWVEVDGVDGIRDECKEIMGELEFRGDTDNSPDLNSPST
ncbi:hypothetical protein MMC31_007317 [Peltigera leucophlebia]|nr:hypothetical protein [Peltigera leucophlebia]